MQPGRTQHIEQGREDALSIRLLDDDGQQVTLSGDQFVTLYAPGGAELVARTSSNVTASAEVATYTITWSSATYQRDHGYRAVWELSDGTDTYYRTQYFSIVRRRFRSQLTDADLTALHPYITQQNLQADLSVYRRDAWEEIEARCHARIPQPRRANQYRHDGTDDHLNTRGRVDDYVGNFFQPERFFLAHKYQTYHLFFLHNSFGPDDANFAKSEEFGSKAREALNLALSRIDFDRDDDGLLDSREQSSALNVIMVDR